MKKFALLAAVAVLTAACSQEAEEPEVANETATAPMPAETMAAGTQPGTYDMTNADGTPRGSTTINPDGTYTDTDAAGNETRGTFASRNGQDCFDPEGDDPEECWTVSTAGPDGSFTATGPDGTEVTIKPRTAGAAPAAAETPTT